MRKKTLFLSSMKKIMFFHDVTRKTCKILSFFEDLNFLNLRSHLKKWFFEKKLQFLEKMFTYLNFFFFFLNFIYIYIYITFVYLYIFNYIYFNYMYLIFLIFKKWSTIHQLYSIKNKERLQKKKRFRRIKRRKASIWLLKIQEAFHKLKNKS